MWTFEYAKPSSRWRPLEEQLVRLVNCEGVAYQALVDALKFAKVEQVKIDADIDSRTITIYEGGNLTGYDDAIVARDHKALPLHKQCPLVEDSDRLTRHWTAGEYRSYWRWLSNIAEAAENETISAQADPRSPRQELFKRPVVFAVPDPPAGLARIQKDLTLTQRKIDSGMKWKLSHEDCPLVCIGSQTYAISSIVKTLASFDDYMLRAAVLVDREQYEKVSGLREERMVARCVSALQSRGWIAQSHLLLRNPNRELDVYATKGRQDLLIQLKSTLRPHSPWEVYKRNSDLLGGISHTAEVLPKLREGALGFVITDGYEGDYVTWKRSMETNVPVATLQDLELIAENPKRAFEMLTNRAGIKGTPTGEPVPEREIDLCGWKILLTDTPMPE